MNEERTTNRDTSCGSPEDEIGADAARTWMALPTVIAATEWAAMHTEQ